MVVEEEASLTAGREEGATGRPDGFGLRGRDVPPRGLVIIGAEWLVCEVELVFTDESDWPDLYRRRSEYRDTFPLSASESSLLRLLLFSTPNLGNSDTGTIVRLCPFVTETMGIRGDVIVGSDPVRAWWFSFLLLCLTVIPGEEWMDRLSVLDRRDVGVELGAGGGSRHFDTDIRRSSSLMILLQL